MALQAVAAPGAGDIQLGLSARFAGEGLYDAARGIAIELRQRARQHLHAGGRAQGHGGRLALPVGRGGRNAVGDEANAAQPKGRPRAKPANGNLHVLRVVVAVERHHARHLGQGLRQIDSGPSLLNGAGVDVLHCCGRVKGFLSELAALHGDLLEGGCGGEFRALGLGCGEQALEGQAASGSQGAVCHGESPCHFVFACHQVNAVHAVIGSCVP